MCPEVDSASESEYQGFWLTTYHPCSAETSRKSGVLTYPEPLGPPRPVAGDFFFFYFIIIIIIIQEVVLFSTLKRQYTASK